VSGQPWAGLTPPYATLVVDPPWPVELDYRPRKGCPVGTRAPYATLPIVDILALSVRNLAAKDAHLYLWITPALNRQGIGERVANAWGFRVISEIIWSKSRLGTGAFPRACHEVLLICRRGALPFQGPRNVRSVQEWTHERGHSRKPSAAYDLIEQQSPGPYVELFARQPRLGWDSWGLGYEHLGEVAG
jgi:N6-adenosine-specific RNA methylase IME4